MKKAVLALVVLLATTPLLALDAYPKTSIAEDATATWCGFCPNAYAGLDIVHGQFDNSQFVSVRYYSTSSGGLYGTPEINARISFYGVSGYPTVVFDGTNKIVGAGDVTATYGEPYLTTVQSATLSPAPVRLEIDSFDPVSGDIDITVTMYSGTDELDNDSLVFVLLEDDVAGNHTHVTRDLVYDTISLNGQGNFSTASVSFDIDPTWTTANLHAVAMVQRAADQEVLQSASTYPQPSYSVRAMMTSPRIAIGPASGTYSTGDFTVMNVGPMDSYTIQVIADQAPAGTQFAVVDEFAVVHTDPYDFDLAADASTLFHVNVMPSAPGQINYHVEITSANLASPFVIPFTYYTDGLDIMLVDDDGGARYEDYFTEVLDNTGLSYGVWNRDLSELWPEIAQSAKLLVWNAGWSSPTLDADDRTFLEQYLDDGQALFVTGQDVGWELNTASAGNYDPTFYQQYLHSTYIRDDTNIYDLNGVGGDPITNGLTLHIAGGTGANNQEYPDEIAAADSDATEILFYQGDGCGATRSVDSISGAKVVNLGFGFEAIDNAQDRNDLLSPAVNWLLDIIFMDGFESGDISAWE